MANIHEILEASELALQSGGEYPWPANSIEDFGGTGIKLDGLSLSARHIKRVKPSSHSFLTNHKKTYQGVKINGTPLTMAEAGTQPHSVSVVNNTLVSYCGAKTIYLYTHADGNLRSVCNGTTTILTNHLYDSYLTTIRRNVQYCILHIFGAGGGGGGGGSTNDGKGGGGGSVLAAIINTAIFDILHPLIITLGAGGEGGIGQFNARDGQNGSDTKLSCSMIDGDVIISSGGGGGSGGAGSPGNGGTTPFIPSTWVKYMHLLSSSAGNAGSGQNGGGLANVSYTDPNAAAIVVNTNQSFASALHNTGGNGGAWGAFGGSDGADGAPGCVVLYY